MLKFFKCIRLSDFMARKNTDSGKESGTVQSSQEGRKLEVYLISRFGRLGFYAIENGHDEGMQVFRYTDSTSDIVFPKVSDEYTAEGFVKSIIDRFPEIGNYDVVEMRIDDSVDIGALARIAKGSRRPFTINEVAELAHALDVKLYERFNGRPIEVRCRSD